MFDVDNTWVYGKNKNWVHRTEYPQENSLPVVSGITVNNGVNYFTNDVPSQGDIFCDSLTISTRGEYSGTVTYHEGKFVLANNILVMFMPKLTKNQKLFIGSLINNLPYGGYSGYPRKETLKQDKIVLPIRQGEIDFDFMENFVAQLEAERIAQLEAERIAQLEAYLSASGLDNYELSDEELKALRAYNSMEWREYKLGELFEVKTYKKRFDANKVTLVSKGGNPYVVRKSTENGIKGFISEDDSYLNEGNTISFGQDTATSFYQEQPYFTGDKIKILKAKFNGFNKENAQFFVSAITRSFSKFSWGSSSYSVDIISNQKLALPVLNNEIDTKYIEIISKAISKLAIKDVVQYTDTRIEATKIVVSEHNKTH